MATTGNDNQLKVWDLRQMKEVHSYYTGGNVKSASISQSGLLAVANERTVTVWKDWATEKQKRPYMKQESTKRVHGMCFQPYQDFLGLGLSGGFQSLVVPGAGLSAFDSFEVNLFQSKKQKREADIKHLLDKLPASTIMMNTNMIGTIDYASKEVLE